jgi:hypothetical protein
MVAVSSIPQLGIPLLVPFDAKAVSHPDSVLVNATCVQSIWAQERTTLVVICACKRITFVQTVTHSNTCGGTIAAQAGEVSVQCSGCIGDTINGRRLAVAIDITIPLAVASTIQHEYN